MLNLNTLSFQEYGNTQTVVHNSNFIVNHYLAQNVSVYMVNIRHYSE